MKTAVLTRAVMPSVANPNGTMFGGELMKWMDELSGIAAVRFAGKNVTTAAVNVSFIRPIPVRSVIELNAGVCYVGNTSMRVNVSVTMDGPEPVKVADAMFVYVAIDDDGHPVPVGKTL